MQKGDRPAKNVNPVKKKPAKKKTKKEPAKKKEQAKEKQTAQPPVKKEKVQLAKKKEKQVSSGGPVESINDEELFRQFCFRNDVCKRELLLR